MGKNLPEDADLYLLISVILLFLMINYNMPLSNIYGFMTIILLIAYLIPIQFNLFRWIPLIKPGDSRLMKVGIGAAFGVAFIYLYNQFSTTPMAAIFATTLFGESEILTKIVYSGLIPLVETIFFFVIILIWWAWKIGDDVHTISPFSLTGLKLMIMFGAVFVVFHATAKGIENTTDLFLTFAFGALSVGMILHFKEVIQAIIMHVVVNADSMDVFPTIQQFAANGSGVLIGVAIVVGLIYFLPKRKKFSLPI